MKFTLLKIVQLGVGVMLCFCAVLGNAKDSSVQGDESGRLFEVINGTAGSTATYPWIVFFRTSSGDQYCGGSLISPTWVLMAGHCFVNDAGNEIDIPTAAMSTVILNSDTPSPLADDAIVAEIG
jgi:secreted trypsin-like serine protease